MAICKNGIARLRVRAANGKDSQLYSDILNLVGDRDDALKIYAFTQSDHFKEVYRKGKLDKNGEPIVEDVIAVAQNYMFDMDSPKRITKDTPGATPKDKGKLNFEKQAADSNFNKQDYRRGKQLKAKKNSILSDVYRQISTAKLNNDMQKVYHLTKRVASIKNDIQEIELEMDAMAMIEFAKRDLKRASAIASRRDKLQSQDLIYLKSIANTWVNAVDTFFPESKNSSYIMSGEGESAAQAEYFEGFDSIEGKAKTLLNNIANLEIKYLNKEITKETDRDTDLREVFEEQKDYTGVHAHTMSINRSDNIMFQVVSDINFRLMSQAKSEFRDFEKKFDETLNAALPDLKAMSSSVNPYDILREKYEDGKETGNLIRQFKPEYDDVAAIKYKEAIDANTAEAWNDFYKWFDRNNIVLDWRILFSGEKDENGDLLYDGEQFTEAEKEKHKQEIIELVGKHEFARMLMITQRNFEDFKATRQLRKDDIAGWDKTDEEKEILFEIWNKNYSPYYYSDVVNNRRVFTMENNTVIPAKGHAYTLTIPRKYIKGSVVETGFYNENFNKIRNNKNVYEFYLTMLDTLHNLNSMLPQNVAKNLKDNSIPNLRKSVIDVWFNEGAKGAKKEIFARLIKAMTADNTSDLAFAEVDPYTNEIKKNLTINLVKENNDRINKIYTQKLIEYEQKGIKADTAKKRELKKEAVDVVVKDKSFDLGEIIKVYYLTTHMYAKKAQLEDLVRISDAVFKEQRETQRTSDNRVKKDIRSGQIAKKDKDESFTNLKKQWDYWLNYFYGYRSEVEGLSHRKLLNEKEKAEQEKILELQAELTKQLDKGEIPFEEFVSKNEKLDRQLIELGGNISAGKIGRGLLKFVQLKAMGWNAFSGITNMAFGWIANVTEANYGLVYDKKDLAWATKKVFNSILKNYTFNIVETEDAKKIRSLVNRLDILSETSNEVYQRTYKSSKSKPFDWLKPFNIQNRTEYFNQAPIMLAIMRRTKFKTVKGELMAYECFNEDGTWRKELGEEPITEIGKMQTKIATEIARVHGNYNSEMPILANKKLWTTALKQFRTWMFEGAADRFQREHYSNALGINISGRYTPGHGGFLFFNYAKTKEQHELQENLSFMDVVNNTGFTIVQLLRKLTFQNTKFEERFTESDAANLRKNLSEFIILMQVSGFVLLLSMLGGDDDDDIFAFYFKNYLLNLLNRVEDDIMYYVSPTSFEQLTKQSVPAMSLITDASKLIDATIDTAMGNGRISRGMYAGEHKLVRAINRNLPFFSKVQANIGAMKQVYNDVSFKK